MKQVFKVISDLLLYQKKKFLVLLLFIIFFLIALFPFDDLNDLMTTKVADQTQNAVYVQADNLGINWLPTPSVKLTSALVQVTNLPNIAADELVISPSVLSLLRGAPGAEVSAKGLFKGNVDVNYEEGEKNKDNERIKKVKINASDVAVSSLSTFLRDLNLGGPGAGAIDLKMSGALSLIAQAKIDPSFEEQPNAQIDLTIKNFDFPAYVIYMSGAPMFNLPELKFKRSTIKTAVADGKLQVDDLSLGEDSDDLSCKVHGDIAMKLAKGRPAPDMGAYNFNVEIKVLQKFYDQNSLLFVLISSFKKPVQGGQKFSFKISGDSLMGQPRISNF